MSPRRADLLLGASCLAWGVSFVMVKDALAGAPPLTFLALRFALAAVILLPFGLRRKEKGAVLSNAGGASFSFLLSPSELRAGLLLAALLGLGFMAQTAGLVYTTPSRSAFMVALSSVPVPLVAFVILGQRPRWLAVLALLVAGVGIYLLTDPERGGMNRGDLLTLITSATFAVQIVAVAEFSRRYDPLRLVWVQTVGTAVLAGAGALALERGEPMVWTWNLAGAIAFTAVFATALALLWQMRAQRHMTSTRAALILCLEPVFAALASWIWLGERLSVTQWVGGALILGGMVAADLPGVKVDRRVTGG